MNNSAKPPLAVIRAENLNGRHQSRLYQRGYANDAVLRAVCHVVTQVLYGSGIGVGGTPVSLCNGETVPLGTF